jgi:hypothetical protein
LAAQSLIVTLLLTLLAFTFMIYLSAPTDDELEREKRWSLQWYCKRCGAFFFDAESSAEERDHVATVAKPAFVSPLIRSTKRNARANYADRVLSPVQRAAAMTERDLAGLNVIKNSAAADGSFHPEMIPCDLGVVSRLASLNLIHYDAGLDRFHLLDVAVPPRPEPQPQRGWWQRTFG